jgi:hypothetical protein
MAICSCGLPACCCQPAFAGGFIYTDLRRELNTHLAPQALFTQSSPGHNGHCYKLCLSMHTGEVTLHPLSQACVVIYSSHGKWVFPPLLWSFSPTATFTSFPTPDCWAFAASPAFSGQLVYLQLTWEVGLPPSPVEFSSHRHFYKLSYSWLLGIGRCSCLLQLACEGFPLSPSLALRVPCPLYYMSLLLLLIIQFLFFP